VIVTDFAIEGDTIIGGNTQFQIDGKASGSPSGLPVGMTAIIDPTPSGSVVQPLTPAVEGDSHANSLTDATPSTFHMLFGDAGNDTLTGSNGADFLIGGAGNDSVYGGDGNDVLVYDKADVKLDGGNGIDIIRIDDGALNLFNNTNTHPLGADTVSDVNLVGNTSIKNAEVLLLTDDAGADPHKGTNLVLHAADVLSMTDNTLDAGETVAHTLHVQGSKGDHLSLQTSDGWTQVGSTITDSQHQSWDVYQTTTSGTAVQLIVDHDVTVNIT
jgi:Ca2+-binding RTX toxin-like protein